MKRIVFVPGDRFHPTADAEVRSVPAEQKGPQSRCSSTETLSVKLGEPNLQSNLQTSSLDPVIKSKLLLKTLFVFIQQVNQLNRRGTIKTTLHNT